MGRRVRRASPRHVRVRYLGRRRHRLLLARDRLGVKPLYWARAGDRLVFGSEIKAILESGLVARARARRRFQSSSARVLLPAPETMFEGISKLLPGHVLTFERGQVEVSRLLGRAGRSRARRGHAGTSRGRSPISRAARGVGSAPPDERRAARCVPVRRHRQQCHRGVNGADDGPAAADVLGRLQRSRVQRAAIRSEVATAHRRGAARDRHRRPRLLRRTPRLVWHEDEPIAHPSSVPLYFVSKLARQDVTVVLTGEGSDELLAGYGKYRGRSSIGAQELFTRSAPPQRQAGSCQGDRHSSRTTRALRPALVPRRRAPPELTFFDTFAGVNLSRQRELLSPRSGRWSTEAAHTERPWRILTAPDGQATLLDRVLYADMKTYLVELLMKQDQMSMAASIESRVPFLDHHLVEFAAVCLTTGSSPDGRQSGFSGRPPRTSFRSGFSIARRWASRCRSVTGSTAGGRDVVKDVLLDSRARHRGIVEPAALERLLSSPGIPTTQDADAVWALLNLELWYRTFIDGEGIQTLPAPATVASRAALDTAATERLSHS